MKRKDLFGRVNDALTALPKAPEEIILHVFNSKYCHFYGLQAWRLTDKHAEVFQSMEPKLAPHTAVASSNTWFISTISSRMGCKDACIIYEVTK